MQQDGVQRLFYSTQHESPNVLTIFVDWDDLQNHIDFTKSRVYGPFMKNLGSILDGEAVLTHVTFNPNPPAAALSGAGGAATECFLSYYDPAISDAEKQDVTGRVEKFLTHVQSTAGFRSVASGWQLEVSPVPGKSDKAKVFLVAIGWVSVDAHMKFRETDAFKNNISLIREAPKIVGTRLFHVHNQEAPGARGAQPVQDEILNPQETRGGPGGPKLHSDASVSGQTGSWGTKKTDFDRQTGE